MGYSKDPDACAKYDDTVAEGSVVTFVKGESNPDENG